MTTAANGGNGSETTNGFSFLVVNSDWTPASKVRLRIRPSNLLSENWGDSLRTGLRTRLDTAYDSSGPFHISALAQGNYAVEIRSGSQRSLTHQDALSISSLSDTIKLQQASTPWFQDVRLAGCKLQLFGFEGSATADAKGAVQWDTLPVGIYAFRATKNKDIVGEGTFQASIGSSSQLLTFVPYKLLDTSAHQHALAILLDASASGANVNANLQGMPIPLQLSKKNFEFAATAPNALRFVSASGLPLPYSVESWDSSNGQANLWLRIDTLKANVSQILQMYWGNRKSGDEPSGTAFDSSNGWWGVWHLRQNLKDASSYGADARGTAAGVIGWHTDGTDSLMLRSLPTAADAGFTISLWILPDTNQRSGAPIIRQVSNSNGSLPFSIRMGPYPTWIEAHYPDSQKDQVTRFPTVAPQGEWLQIAVTYDALKEELRLYLNGQQWGDAASVQAHGLKMDGYLLVGGLDTATSSGSLADRLGFKGLVKEIRVSRTVRSASWISAEYSFQRETYRSPLQIQRLR
jgi:hypothetical protein